MRRRHKFKPGDHVQVIRTDADCFGGSMGDHGIIDRIGVGDRCYIKFETYNSCGNISWPFEAPTGNLYVMPENLVMYTPPVYVIQEEPCVPIR